MKICVIGAGYVGVVTGACFAKLGHTVVCVDVIKEKVDAVNTGRPLIYEDGLEQLLREAKKRISATSDLKSAAKDADVIFICVGTPSKKDGGIDLAYVTESANQLEKALESGEKTVVIKSTVLPGTAAELAKRLKGKANIAVNPEFLREGHAIEDFMSPDRIVVGTESERARRALEELYSGFDCPKIFTDFATAEMIKYASNAFLATKISFINEIGNICKRLGIDVYKVAEGMGHDERIGRLFLNAGAGFGGSCFPKDLRALIRKAEQSGYEPQLLSSVMKVNDAQPAKLLEIARKRGLKGKTVAVLGLAFKPGTDDIRESPAIKLIGQLLDEAGAVRVYDPKAMENTKKAFGDKLYYAASAQDALDGAHVCFLMTAWDEFKNKGIYKNKELFVIDGKNVVRLDSNYEGIGW